MRPKTLTAAAAPVLVGAGLAEAHGAFALFPVVAALAGAVCIQIGTNFANDYYDFVRGADGPNRVGPVRVTQAGLIPPAHVWWGMVAVLAAAASVGVYLVVVGGWPIVWIGLASLLCAVAYTGGPYPLAYHGLGDPFVFVFFGLIAVGGTYWVQALAVPGDVLLAGAGMGALSTAILGGQQPQRSRNRQIGRQAYSGRAVGPEGEPGRVCHPDGGRVHHSGPRG